MTRLDLELSSRDVAALNRLALAQFGDESESSVNRVMESALALRLVWLKTAGTPAETTHDPVLDWTAGSDPNEVTTGTVPEWLFRGNH